MAKYTKEEILELYNEQLEVAKSKLKELKIYCGDEIKLKSLNGWVFEQVVQFCLTEELKALGIENPEPEGQFPFKYFDYKSGKEKNAKIDLKVGNKILVEVKGYGYLYSPSDEEKYKNIKKSANDKEYVYLYITKDKENSTYIEKAIKLFEEVNCFFLFDEKEDNWQKFVERVTEILKQETKITDNS